jgi:hypothetical protein
VLPNRWATCCVTDYAGRSARCKAVPGIPSRLRALALVFKSPTCADHEPIRRPVHVWSTQIRASQSSDDRLGSDQG